MLQKVENYRQALAQLERAIQVYEANPHDDLYRDGLIQRFEFTVELAWKSLKDYLEDQGFVLGVSSPRAILKEAFAAGVILDAEAWNDILKARNITSHVYDEATAEQVVDMIVNNFVPPLKALADFYTK